jgi:small subunit ribosomal protein S16
MLRIRLRRVGAKKQPSYRVVVADSRSPRDGRFVETIGFYNPRTEPPTVEIKEDRALYWLVQGAQPSEAVAGLLKGLGTMERLARVKSGESLDAVLASLSETAAAQAETASPASAKGKRSRTREVSEAAEAEAAEGGTESEEVPTTETEVNV